MAGKHTLAFPNVSKLLNSHFRAIIPSELHEFRFTSVTVNKDYASKRHRDGNNMGPSMIRAFGDFQGGELEYFPNDNGKKAVESLDDAHKTRLNIHGHLVLFDGRRAHQVAPFRGRRFSVIWYCCPRAERADHRTRASLRSCGFSLPQVGAQRGYENEEYRTGSYRQ